MEQNSPMIAKKIWNLMRVAFYMLRKGICKRKILLDLNLVMKRGKLAGKALQNLMFHHHHHRHSHQSSRSKANIDGPSHLQYFSTIPPGEHEFSCSTTPLYPHYLANKKKHDQSNLFFYTPCSSFEEMCNVEALNNIFDIMNSSGDSVATSPAVSTPLVRQLRITDSPAVSNPPVRQLRITDSPFPEQNPEDGKHVDAAAEDFINKFYSQLKKQKYS